jgi:hypothetical protein
MKKKPAPKIKISNNRSIRSEFAKLIDLTDVKVVKDFDDVVPELHLQDLDDKQLLNIQKMIQDELDAFHPVSRDLRIDDSSMPTAKNFYHFCMDEAFLNSPPYLEQAIIGIKLMAEYCPRPTCTDMKWFSDDGHEANEPMSNLTKKVSLLRNGICPKCGARKSELIANGELNFYNELAVVAGQRCVTGDTIVFTDKGLKYIGDIGNELNTGYNKLELSVHNGKSKEKSKELYVTDPEKVYYLKLKNGFELCGTHEHPVLTKDFGYKAITQLTEKDYVKVVTGLNSFGTKSIDLSASQIQELGKSPDQNTVKKFFDLKLSFVKEFLLGYYKEQRIISKQAAYALYSLSLNIGILPSIVEIDSDSFKLVNNKALDYLTNLIYIGKKTYYLPVISSGKTERIERMYDFTMPKTQEFITSGVQSHNSGKSALSTMISAYVLHLFLKCGKPTELFGIRSNEVLHGTFLALTLGQATQNLWQPFLGYINNSPWFKSYHSLLRKYERKYGETILKLKDTFIEYRHRNLQLYPATPDKRTLRGRTRFLGVLDELGWFDSNRDTKKVKDNAHEVYKAMSNSLATARQSEKRLVALGYDQFLLTGYMLNVSSPNNIRDKIMELYKQSIGSKKSLGLHKPTWKMNPHITFDGPLIQEEYRKDPIGAERDFGAQPSLSSNPFMSNHRLIQETVRTGQKNWVKYRSKIDRVSKDEKYRTVELLNIKRNDSVSVLAIDAGYSNNSFAVVCGSIHDGTPHLDILIEIISLPGIPISHTRIFSDVILPLIEHRNVKILLADRWNSIKLLQDAKASYPGLEISAQYSLKYNDMCDVKTAVELGAIKIPYIENPSIKDIMENINIDSYPNCFDGKPVEHLLVQMATVVDVGKKTIDKGDGFTDDLWRAGALCHWGLVHPEYQEILAKKVEQSKIKQPPLAVVRKLGSYDKLTSSSGNRVFSGSTKYIGVKKSSR